MNASGAMPARPLPMMTGHNPHRLAIVGASGSGKTTYLTRFLARAPASCRFVYDPEGELAQRLGQFSHTDAGALARATASAWCIFDPSAMFPGNNAAGFDYFAKFAFHASSVIPGRKLWVCDEVQKFCPPSRPLPHGAALIFDTGRRWGLDVAVISQAPQRAHGDARNQFTELVCFNLIDPKAREWALDFGLSTDPINLRPGQYIARNLKSGAEVSGKVF